MSLDSGHPLITVSMPGSSRTSEASAPVMLKHPVICVVGPTASGKTDLAQLLAQHFDGEVVSADSMQVYQGMDIGTGKIAPHERIVPHHCIDLVKPGEEFSASLFQRISRACFRDIDSRGKRVVLAGGTGFYVRAAIDGYVFPAGEQRGNQVRDACNAYAQTHGGIALWNRLRETDQLSAEAIEPADVKRVARAFELHAEGLSYASQKARLGSIPQVVPALFLGLAVDPDVLRQRIRCRVDSMVASGLVEEVQSLLDQGLREGVTSPQAIGYKEIVAALDGKQSIEDSIEQIKIATCRYAKRQRTWFRKDHRIHWLCADSGDTQRLFHDALEVLAKIDG